jgi:hypothetical protein
MKKDEVNSMVAEISGAQPGDRKHFLGAYQGGLSKIVQNLSGEDKASYQIIADQWNKEGLPEQIRHK